MESKKSHKISREEIRKFKTYIMKVLQEEKDDPTYSTESSESESESDDDSHVVEEIFRIVKTKDGFYCFL